jgi:subtilisin family serine protease
VTFTGINRVPSRIEIVGGDGQTVVNGPAAATEPLEVRLLDSGGAAVEGAIVRWTPASGSGTTDPAESTTNANGVAATDWTLGPNPGVHTLAASTAAVPGVAATFVAEHVQLQIDVATATDPMPPAGFVPARGTDVEASASAARFGAGGPGDQRMPADGYATRRLIIRHDPAWVGLAAEGPALAEGSVRVARQALARATSEWMADGRVAHAELSPVILTTRVTVPEQADVDQLAAELRTEPGVLDVHIEHLYPLRGDARRAPRPLQDSPKAVRLDSPSRQAPSEVEAGTTLPSAGDVGWFYASWHYNAVDVRRAWTTTQGSEDVVVAVVDDGIRFDHPDIAANLTDDGYNFVAGGPVFSVEVPICDGGSTDAAEAGYGPDPTQPMSWIDYGACLARSFSGNHGLHVAGTIGAVHDEVPGSATLALGLNRHVRIRPVRVLNTLGWGSWFDIAQGVLYAAGLPASDGAGGTVTAPSAAPIINMSLGGGYDDSTLHDAIIAAHEAGSLIVASAGNGRTSWPSYPAAYDEALSVVALGPDLNLAAYTNIGPAVDVAAPGGDTRAGAASAVFSTTWNFEDGMPSYDWWQGTSMAAPHVSGIAALVLAANPDLSRDGLRERLLQTAVPLGPEGWDPRWGHGLVNAYNAVTNRPFGAPRSILARLYEAETGLLAAEQATDGAGRAHFVGVPEGDYWVVAGTSIEDDGELWRPSRALGWSGAPGEPELVSVRATGPHTEAAAVHLSAPLDPGTNLTFETAHRVPVETHVVGVVGPDEPYAYYRVRIPYGSLWRFSTHGVLGACGLATELDTVITLFDASGNELDRNDDTGVPQELNDPLCSQIERVLDPGDYVVRVEGFDPGMPGRFSLNVRSVPVL